jgi:hypothetical protein
MYSRYCRIHPRSTTNWHKNPLFVPRRVNKADIFFIGRKTQKSYILSGLTTIIGLRKLINKKSTMKLPAASKICEAFRLVKFKF